MSRFHLRNHDGQLCLEDRSHPKQQPLSIDFNQPKLRHRVEQGGKKELLLRAVGVKAGLRVQDWTAGLGTDSLLLATAGCQVTMFERSRVIAALLKQALNSKDERLAPVLERMQLNAGDAREFPEQPADVVYLDPMFPQSKKTALVNGPMQYLQRLLGPDHDAEQIIQAALKRSVKRVVVKRPASAPEANATFVLSAKANRFDVYELSGADCS